MEFVFDDLVVIFSAGIAANNRGFRVGGLLRGVVVVEHDDQGAGAFHEKAGIEALIHVPGHILHGAMHPFVGPAGQAGLLLLQGTCRHHGAIEESQFQGFNPDSSGH